MLTVLFTDIVGSTERALKLGDHAWADLIDRHHAIVRAALRRHRGRELDTAGDGFFAGFERPTDALACAVDVVTGLQSLDLHVRVGIHAGEVETVDGKVGGIGVHLAARLMAQAGADEILTSGTVRDLAAGGGWIFESIGPLALKGLPEPVVAFRLDRASGPTSVGAKPGGGGAAPRGRSLSSIGAVFGLAVAGFAVAAVLVLPRLLAPSSPPPSVAHGSTAGASTSSLAASPSLGTSAVPVAITWSLVTPSGLSATHIAGIGGVGSGGCCLVVGSNAKGAAAWGSADGHTFSAELAPTDRGALLADTELNGEMLGESTFVIVGSDCSAGQDRCTAAAWWTTDPGVAAWTRSTFADRLRQPSGMLGVGVGGPGYVAVGTVMDGGRRSGAAWTSPDGKRWSRADARGQGPGEGVRDVVEGAGLMVAVGGSPSGSVVWTSADGRSWQAEPRVAEFAGATLDSVTWTGDRFVAVGNGPSGPGIWTSSDGRSWAVVTDLPHLAFVSLQGIAQTPPTVFVIGESGGTATFLVGCCTR